MNDNENTEVTPAVAPEVTPAVAPEVTPEVAPEVTPEVAKPVSKSKTKRPAPAEPEEVRTISANGFTFNIQG